jgi:predicted AAA+ superfamily ATPase
MERYNPWWADEPDTGYLAWTQQPVRWVPDIVKEISLDPFALHFITGPRQVGKTTALKILIGQLLEQGREPKSILYYSCDELTDHHELGEVLDGYYRSRDAWGVDASVIILDEITFVKDWWRSVKTRIDQGLSSKDIMIITGSVSVDLLKQKEMFPGRRGNGKDLVLRPLDFSTYSKVSGDLELKRGNLDDLDTAFAANSMFSDRLRHLFDQYMLSGGFPLAIQDLHRHGKVTTETERAYLDWMKGDWNKAGKSDRYMKEVLSYLARAKGTPISWNGITSETSIDSPHTARSYVEVLEGMYAALILHNLRPDGRIEYKKNKKVHLTDPFIMRLVSNYTGEGHSHEWAMEAVAASHVARRTEAYYWRGKTECDVVALVQGRQVGFEVKTGVGRWRPPWHIKESYLLDRDSFPVYMSTL